MAIIYISIYLIKDKRIETGGLNNTHQAGQLLFLSLLLLVRRLSCAVDSRLLVHVDCVLFVEEII